MPEDKNPFVGIGASLGGISVAIVAIVLIFASDQAWILTIIIPCLAVMGILLGYFASKRTKKK